MDLAAIIIELGSQEREMFVVLGVILLLLEHAEYAVVGLGVGMLEGEVAVLDHQTVSGWWLDSVSLTDLSLAQVGAGDLLGRGGGVFHLGGCPGGLGSLH